MKQDLRNQRFFLIAMGVFIVLSSFLYGFVRGSKNYAVASAPPVLQGKPVAVKQSGILLKALLPRDAALALMGNDMELNGLDAEMINFTIDRPLHPFLMEMQAIWRNAGYEAVQQTSDRRAISFAMHESNGSRVSLVVWEVAEAVRAATSNGDRLQGTLSYVAEGNENKRMAGVPIMEGAVAGAVLASTDLGKRTITGSFNNPGLLAESRSFYSNALALRGWQRVHSGAIEDSQREMVFRRDLEELTLVFAKLPQQVGVSSYVMDRTLVTAVLKRSSL